MSVLTHYGYFVAADTYDPTVSAAEVQRKLAGVHKAQFLEAMDTYQSSMKNPKFSKIDLRSK